MTLDPHEQLATFASPAFPGLLPAQATALTAARQNYAQTPDLAIELPTGSGKTLIGLLLAHEVMSSGGSAVYLTPTRQLSNQAAEEANALGLPADVFEAPLAEVPLAQIRRVNRGRRLGIFNYAAYFSEAALVDPPDLLIFDDAHLAEDAVAARYSVIVRRRDHAEQFDQLIELIGHEAPGYPVVDDLAADRPEVSRQVQLLAFGDVSRLLWRARDYLTAAATNDPTIRYPLRRIGDRLDRCLWLVDPDALTIRPLRFPLSAEARFSQATRRIYLSATMGDLFDLRRRLGTPPLTSLALPSDLAGSVPGRRHLVLVDEPLDDVGRAELRDRLSNATPRRVWFCRSTGEAEQVRDDRAAAGRTARILDRDGVALTWFRNAHDADLVLAARYDGMDFANEEARLAFFPSAPFGTDPFDEFMAANFPRSGFLIHRLAERLTQALGRITRGEDDWAVCVIEGAELARILSRRDVLRLMPDILASEIEDAWDRLDSGLAANVALAERVLNESTPIPPLGNWRRPAAAGIAWQGAWADWEAGFGDGLHAGTHDVSIASATRLLNALGEHSLRPWWLYLRAWSKALSAEHDHHIERNDAAIVDLESSIRAAGPTTWFGRVAAMANRMRGAGTRATRLDDPLVEFCDGRTDAALERWLRTTEADLRSSDHDRVARAWTQVGLSLGFDATQPSGGGATDSRWQGRGGIHVFEAKIEHLPGSRISRREVNQLLGQIEEERPGGQPTYGAFLTHMEQYEPDVGNSASAIAIFGIEAALAVWSRVASGVQAVTQARRSSHRAPAVGPVPGWLEELATKRRGGRIEPVDVDREWSRDSRGTPQ